MLYKNILETDLKVSSICLGSADIGSTIDKETSFKLMDEFCEKGGNFIDTANIYADWLPVEKSISEKTIGKWLKAKGNREKLVIATKGAHPRLESMNVPRLSKEEILNDLNQSLQSLQTDYVDLYWLHRDDENRPVGEILETLNEQVKAGKIRYYGCSNWKPRRIKEAMDYAVKANIKGFVANQMMWSFAKPNIEGIKDTTLALMDEDTTKFHKETKLAAVPYSSQANGFFTKLDNINKVPMKESIKEKYYNDVNISRLVRIKKLSAELSVSVGEIVLAYLTSQSFNTIPIVGCRTTEQLKESLKAGDLVLSEDMLSYLEKDI